VGLVGIVGFIVGLIVDRVVGLIVGFIVGLAAGLTVGLIVELIVGLIAGLIVGLIVGLGVAGQFWGLGLGEPHPADAQSDTSQGTLQASAPHGHPPVFCGNPEARDMPLMVGTEAE